MPVTASLLSSTHVNQLHQIPPLTSVYCPPVEARRSYCPAAPGVLKASYTQLCANRYWTEIRADEVKNRSAGSSPSRRDASPPRTDCPVVGVMMNAACLPGLNNVVVGVWDYLKRTMPSTRVIFYGSWADFICRAGVNVNEKWVSERINMGAAGSANQAALKDIPGARKIISAYVRDVGPLVVIGEADDTFAALDTNPAARDSSMSSSGTQGDMPSSRPSPNQVSAGVVESKVCAVKGRVCIVPVSLKDCARRIAGHILVPLGLDTVTKRESEVIGNVSAGVATYQDRYHIFGYTGTLNVDILTLECMLQCRPNLVVYIDTEGSPEALILQAATQIAELIVERAKIGKYFGIVFLGNALAAIDGAAERAAKQNTGEHAEWDSDGLLSVLRNELLQVLRDRNTKDFFYNRLARLIIATADLKSKLLLEKAVKDQLAETDPNSGMPKSEGSRRGSSTNSPNPANVSPKTPAASQPATSPNSAPNSLKQSAAIASPPKPSSTSQGTGKSGPMKSLDGTTRSGVAITQCFVKFLVHTMSIHTVCAIPSNFDACLGFSLGMTAGAILMLPNAPEVTASVVVPRPDFNPEMWACGFFTSSDWATALPSAARARGRDSLPLQTLAVPPGSVDTVDSDCAVDSAMTSYSPPPCSQDTTEAPSCAKLTDGEDSVDRHSTDRFTSYHTEFVSKHLDEVLAWRLQDVYRNPGPLQFLGPCSNASPLILSDLDREYLVPSGTIIKAHFPITVSMLSPLQRQRLRSRSTLNPILLNPRARAVNGQSDPQLTQAQETARKAWFPNQGRRHNLIIYAVDEYDKNNSDAAAPLAPNPLTPSHSSSLPDCHHNGPPERAATTGQLSTRNAKLPTAPPSCGTIHGHGALQSKWHQVVGVVLAGQPASGVSNVLYGLFERCALTSSHLIGYKGVKGLIEQDWIKLDREMLITYVNGGGFELLGHSLSGRRDLRTRKGLSAVAQACRDQKLDGLVLIGGQTTLTDAAVVTEHLLAVGVETCVVCVPVSHELNVRHGLLEMTIGFDTRCHTYSTRIGELLNYMRISDQQQWCFVRIHGRSPSMTMMEVAFRTHPDVVLLPELYEQNGEGVSRDELPQLIEDLVGVLRSSLRSEKRYGIVLVPADLIIRLSPACHLCDRPRMAPTPEGLMAIEKWPERVREVLPYLIAQQDIFGFPVEELIALWCEVSMTVYERKSIKLKPVSFGLGASTSMPNDFDCALSSAHGMTAGILIESNLTGYVTSLRDLCGPPERWRPTAVPIPLLITEHRTMRDIAIYGLDIPMVSTPKINLDGKIYKAFSQCIELWRTGSTYSDPGPIQFTGKSICRRPIIMLINRRPLQECLIYFRQLIRHIQKIHEICYDEPTLRTTVNILKHLSESVTRRK